MCTLAVQGDQMFVVTVSGVTSYTGPRTDEESLSPANVCTFPVPLPVCGAVVWRAPLATESYLLFACNDGSIWALDTDFKNQQQPSCIWKFPIFPDNHGGTKYFPEIRLGLHTASNSLVVISGWIPTVIVLELSLDELGAIEVRERCRWTIRDGGQVPILSVDDDGHVWTAKPGNTTTFHAWSLTGRHLGELHMNYGEVRLDHIISLVVRNPGPFADVVCRKWCCAYRLVLHP